MNGPHVPDDTLEAYLMGRLPPGSEATVEEHLLGCEHCINRTEDLEAQLRAIRSACARSLRIAETVVKIADPRKPAASGQTNRRFRIIAENLAASAAAIWLMIMIPSWFPMLNQRPAVQVVEQLGRKAQLSHTLAPSVETPPPYEKQSQAAAVSSGRPRPAHLVQRGRSTRIAQRMTLPRMGPIRPFELPQERLIPIPELALLDAPPPLAMDDAEVDLSQIDPPTPPRPHGNILRAFAAPFRRVIRFLTKTTDAEAATVN